MLPGRVRPRVPGRGLPVPARLRVPNDNRVSLLARRAGREKVAPVFRRRVYGAVSGGPAAANYKRRLV